MSLQYIKNRSKDIAANNTKKFGAKYSNLVFLDEVTKRFNISNLNFTVSVPPFFGIEHDTMIKFIEENLGYEDIEKDWKAIQELAQEMKKNNWESREFICSEYKLYFRYIIRRGYR